MENLKNKKLLVLGGTIATYDVVKVARQMGIHVIVADYFEKGISKDIADESIQISTTDMNGLCRLIEEKKIDGVFTGASEFNIRNMINLCTKAGLPIYTSLELWEICSNKKSFKQACEKHQVPVVPEYDLDSEQDRKRIQYPVIVKPVDSFSGHGISVCSCEKELDIAVEKAKENSKSGNIIVEHFVQGDNVEVYYLVQEGKVMLMTAADRYTDKEQHGSPVPTAFYHPSRYLAKYMDEVNPKVCAMFEQMGIKNGVFFMESFVENGKFMFYEMGLRLNATQEYHFVDYFNAFNPLKMMISYALTGTMGESVEEKNNPCFSGRACEIALLLKQGEISAIKGMEQIGELPFVIHSIQYHNLGDVIEEIGNLDQHFARIKVVAKNEEDLEAAIHAVYTRISVKDQNGNEMLIKEREEK